MEIMLRANLVCKPLVNVTLYPSELETHFFKEDQSWVVHNWLALSV
jgi:hypothetical protein